MTARFGTAALVFAMGLTFATIARADCKTYSLQVEGCGTKKEVEFRRLLADLKLADLAGDSRSLPAELKLKLSCGAGTRFEPATGRRKAFADEMVRLSPRIGDEQRFPLSRTKQELSRFLADHRRSMSITPKNGASFEIVEPNALAGRKYSAPTVVGCLPDEQIFKVKSGAREFSAQRGDTTLEPSNQFEKRYFIHFTNGVAWPDPVRIRLCLNSECPADGFNEKRAGLAHSELEATTASIQIDSGERRELKPREDYSWVPEWGVDPVVVLSVDDARSEFVVSRKKPLYGAVCQVLPTSYSGLCTKRFSIGAAVALVLTLLAAANYKRVFKAIYDRFKRARDRRKRARADWVDDDRPLL